MGNGESKSIGCLHIKSDQLLNFTCCMCVLMKHASPKRCTARQLALVSCCHQRRKMSSSASALLAHLVVGLAGLVVRTEVAACRAS
jgi:hypothetical protein